MSLSRLLSVVLLGLILGVGASQAAPSKRAPQKKQANLTADETFVLARNAAVRSDAAKLDSLAGKLTTHPLHEYVDYWQLRLRLLPVRDRNGDALGSDGRQDDRVRRFLDHHDGKLVADLLRRDWMLDLGRRGEWQELIAQYDRWLARDDSRADCYYWLALHRNRQTLPAQAQERLFAPKDLGDGCLELLITMAEAGDLSDEQLWQRLKISLEIGALGSVRRIGALIGLRAGALKGALDQPEKSLARGLDKRLHVIAAVQLSRKDPERMDAKRDVIGSLPREERDFVISQIAAQSMRRLLPQSLQLAREAIGARASDETWSWLARAALRHGDWALLHAVYESMGTKSRNDPAWIYWHARADRELGRPNEATDQLRSIAGQTNFYGMLAAEELGELFYPPKPPPRPTPQEFAQAENNPGLKRAIRFYDLGLRNEGNREWNFQLRLMNDRQLIAAAEFACRRELLDRCVNTADRTQSEHDFTLRYITPFRDRLTPLAEEHDLDPAWIYGLIRQESRFLRSARSSASAQGLMQIIPPTGKWIARKLGVKDFRVEQLNELNTNLRFGTFYLKTVYEGLDGSAVLASAGYNAGPGRPRRWRNTLPGAVEGARFAELIPFNETRDYVQKVLSNATVYAALLSGQPQSLKARLGSIEPAE
jgi:soluble lytic murein transglycosylase